VRRRLQGATALGEAHDPRAPVLRVGVALDVAAPLDLAEHVVAWLSWTTDPRRHTTRRARPACR
jgi:hypothetical protein